MKFYISFPSSKAPNPFVSLLNEHLLKLGWKEYITDEFWLKPIQAFRLRNKVRIIHFHWPEYIWRSNSFIISVIKAIAFITYVYYLKLIGYKITCSMHNLIPHFGKVFTNIEIPMRKWILKNMDLIVGHSDNVYEDILSFYKMTPSRYVLVRHGLYENYLENENINLTLAQDLNSIKKIKVYHAYSKNQYKGSKWFLEQYAVSKHQGLCLVLSGNVPSVELNKLKQARIDFFYFSENFHGVPGFLSEKSLITLIQKSNYIILPYKDITTSGAYFLALTFDKPVIAPDLSFFIATAQKGRDILYNHHSETAIPDAINAIQNMSSMTFEQVGESKTKYNWRESAKVLANSYDNLINS